MTSASTTLDDLLVLTSMAARARARAQSLERDCARLANARVMCAAVAVGAKDYHIAPLPEVADAPIVRPEDLISTNADADADLETRRMALLKAIGASFEAAEAAHERLAQEVSALSDHAGLAVDKFLSGETFDSHVEKVAHLSSEVERLDAAHKEALAEKNAHADLLRAYGHDLGKSE